MNTKIKLMHAIMASIVITGCASTASGPSFNEAKATHIEAGNAIVYVYRDYAEPTAWGADIKIDNKEVETLNQGGFTWFYAKPGKRLISAVWSRMASQRDAEISIFLSPEKAYYIELTGVSRADLVGASFSGGTQTHYINVDVNSGLQQVENDHAKMTLTNCCKYQGANNKYY